MTEAKAGPTPNTSERRLATAREYKRKHRAHLLRQYREYNARVASDPELKRRKLEQNRASSKRNSDKRREYDRQRDPVKNYARLAIRHRIEDGNLVRQPCVICDVPRAQAHHEDYAKPFDIAWLCPTHHRQVHDGRLILTEKEIVYVG